MIKANPLVASAVVHAFLLSAVFILGFRDGPMEAVVDTVRIRLRSSTTEIGSGMNARPQGSAPGDVPREDRESARLPGWNRRITGETSPDVAPAIPVSAEITRPHAEMPAVSSSISGLGALDPLEGLDIAAPESQGRERSDGRWDMSWENGENRGILSFPMVDADEFPDISERLMNLSIDISVSSGGDVVSAIVRPPGSGDVRIDRRMNALALQLVFEPLLEGSKVQEGTLRLVFSGGGS